MSNTKIAKPKTPTQERSNESKTTSLQIDGYSITVPHTSFGDDDQSRANTLGNFDRGIKSKFKLIKKALNVSDKINQYTDGFKSSTDGITIEWWDHSAKPEDLHAAMVFFSKLISYCKEHKVQDKDDKDTENEKYAFRCFLLKIGVIGSDFKADRETMLSRLEGSSSFKNGKKGAKLNDL